jgi:hypothetical protein
MQQAAQERAGGDNGGTSSELDPDIKIDPEHRVAVVNDADRLTLFQVQVGLTFAYPLHSPLVSLLVALRSGSSHRRSFAAIQHSKLQTCHIRSLGHLTADGINLSHELPLCGPADCRIAGHLGDGIQVT